jgi:DNA-binding transcriptional regulator GbsR (MarR family)
MNLSAVTEIVLHWGKLGTRWGISPTVAQIHAQLYSRSAEEIADALSVARCKVSTSLKEL